MMCRLYGVTRSGYNLWRRRKESSHSIADSHLIEKIRAIFKESRGTYGSPRICQALRQRGIRVGEKRVARLMRQQQLRARSVKIYRRVPGSHKYFTNIPNRQRKSIAELPNQIWVGDVTYLRLGSKWHYLAVIMDRCSRMVVGWALSENKDVALTLKALNRAVRDRRPEAGLIFHSDRGNEYGAHLFRKRLAQLKFTQSMNRPRRMTDNACMESFFHSFKSDCYHKRRFRSDDELIKMIRSYIPFYNQERLHSSLSYQSPVQYEQLLC